METSNGIPIIKSLLDNFALPSLKGTATALLVANSGSKSPLGDLGAKPSKNLNI